MPSIVGFVSGIVGHALIEDSSGLSRPLVNGQHVYAGDTILTTGASSQVEITALDESLISIKGDATKTFSQHQSQDEAALLEQLHNNILSNDDFDINQLAATSAGGDTNSPPHLEPEAARALVSEHSSHANISTLDSNKSAETDLSAASEKVSLSSLNNSSENPQHSLLNFEESPLLAAIDQSFSAPNEPNIVQLSAANTTEDFQLSFDGQIAASAEFAATTFESAFGHGSIDAGGQWQYQLNNAASEVQALGAGDALTDSLSFETTAGVRYQVEVNIHGTNDTPIVTGDQQARVQENGDSSALSVTSGRLTIHDSDAGESQFREQNDSDSNYGRVNLDAEGNWQYQLNNELDAIKALGEGDTLIDHFSATSLDGSTHLVRISIEGSNDSPIFSGSNQADLDLESATSSGGRLHIADNDFGESAFQATSNISAKYGLGSIDSNGNWHYQVDTGHSKVTTLGEGQTLYDQFVVFAEDGTQQGVIVSIQGSDNPAFTETNSIAASTAESASPLFSSHADEALLIDQPEHIEAPTDLYIWQADPHNSSDTISGFTLGPEGDKLVINDLLLEAESDDSLEQYLHFEISDHDTTIAITPQGETQSDEGQQHLLVLKGVDLSAYGNSDGEIIQQLLQQGNLDING